jgi:hypothetical protein
VDIFEAALYSFLLYIDIVHLPSQEGLPIFMLTQYVLLPEFSKKSDCNLVGLMVSIKIGF